LILKRLQTRPLDYFKQFYADTAVFGSAAATVCGLDFYGEDQVLFASDAPFDPEKGPGYIRQTINIIEELDLSPETRQKIFQDNAIKLLRLQL
jgi:aminocarboxymuconate-semialdehyde decarboxylase